MIQKKRLTTPILGFLGLIIVAVSAWLFFSTQFAKANDSFNAENIISDSIFTNKDAMTVSQIQSFLDSKGSACLANFKTLSLYDDNSDGLGDEPYGRGVGEQVSAATVIWQASQLYKINPQVILATLQKEQGLVTRGDCPSWRYNTALGYGCPDSEPCDVSAYGFTRQIDYGTWHFKGFFEDSYPVPPTIPGSKFIAYNPDAARCGGRTITIQNRATAALYSYTPYQPNAATLAAPQGQLVDCGAYGNLNFWRYFTQWFGSTQYEQTYLRFKSHISYHGWTDSNINRGVTGFTGQNKPMEGFKIDGELEYSSYNATTGWQPTLTGSMISGTTGQNKSIQAVKINPTGSLANKYDIWYRAHVSYVGWMGWTRNGQVAGVTGGEDRNIEAMEIQLLPKNSSAPGSTATPYQNISTTINNSPLRLSVTSHVGLMGWQPTVTDGMTTGITEQNRRIEALKIGLTNQTGLTGGIAYSVHNSGTGWQGIRSQDELAGTTGEFRRTEAFRATFTGQLAENYDIWYRGYVEFIGWLGWEKNGAPAGSVGAGRQLEAIEIRITPKNSPAPYPQGGLYNPSRLASPDDYSIDYSSHVGYVGWTVSVPQNTTSGTTGKSRYLEAFRIDGVNSLKGNLTIGCSAYVKDTGWTQGVVQGNTCGTTGQTKSLEALKFTLSGAAANNYDIYYKVHLSWLGWQDWVKNDEVAGTPNSNKLIEAVVVKLVKK